MRTLRSAPLVRTWDERRYEDARLRHATTLRSQLRDRESLLEALEKHMIVVQDASSMIPGALVADAQARCKDLARDVSSRSTLECAPSEISPAVYAWGLADQNLDLAEAYLGLPPKYLGVSIKREKADAAVQTVRQWHVDIEDRRMLKVIIYLSHVTADDGPFEYLDRANTLAAARALRYGRGFVSDADLACVVERAQWRTVVGPPLTAAFVDTCRLFHRARPPRCRDRYSLSYSYCSEQARRVFRECLPPRSFVAPMLNQLNDRQRVAALST